MHRALGAQGESPEEIADGTGETLRYEIKLEAASWCMLEV